MSQPAPINAVRVAVEAATAVTPDMAARFYLPLPPGADIADVGARIVGALAPLPCTLAPISPLVPNDLVLDLPGRMFVEPGKAFDAARALEAALGLPLAEPEIFHGVMPADPDFPVEPDIEESAARLLPGCWAAPEPRIEQDRDWALRRMRVHEAWAYADAVGRPSRGEGIVVAQPDTGITAHPELQDVLTGGAFNLLEPDRPNDATDPMDYPGAPGHGTGTASVVISGTDGVVLGAAPRARHMPIRAIHSVMRLSQIRVAQAIDKAVDAGAAVITMSLGGIYSFALQRAVARAVAADVIVLAAAGNCVNFVVWPARFDDCIAVAGTDFDDAPWRGTCRGPDVDIAAPGQNVYRASASDKSAGQGQGTSFAVALTAGVAACWLAFHGRANVIASARLQRLSVQALFRRILRATARTPGGDWDVYTMGPGIVDAHALLMADFEVGRETETPELADRQPPLERSVRDFALEAAVVPAQAGTDWMRLGTELSLVVLRGRAHGAHVPLEGAQDGAGLSQALASALAAPSVPSVPLVTSLSATPPTLEPTPPTPPVLRQPMAAPCPLAPVEQVQARRRILAARQRAATSGGLEGLLQQESMLPPDAPLPDPDSLLQEIERIAAALPAREIGDPQAFRRALETVLEHGDRALHKLDRPGHGPGHGIDVDELAALEAIVVADGSRPSFLLDGGLPPLAHPFYGIWEQQILDARDEIGQVARSIGRIQPKGGHASLFLGTGALVDRDQQLVLTNYHVLDDARTKLGIPMTRSDGKLTIHGGLEIDFVGEASSLERNCFDVVEAVLPHGFGRGFGFLDAALLRIAPQESQSSLPQQAAILSPAPAYANGGVTALCTIGFPGRPDLAGSAARIDSPPGNVDWRFVTATLFGNLFGFKRLAPGRFTRALASDARDTRKIVFGHDATTFGGASGSPILMLAGRGQPMPAFGLHFAGVTERANYAIAAASTADALQAIGVPFH